MATPIGRPVSPTYTAATPPPARVAQPTSIQPPLETSKPIQTQESFGGARQSVVGKSTETVNPSQGGQQVKQGIDQVEPSQLLEQGQGLMESPVVKKEFGSLVSYSGNPEIDQEQTLKVTKEPKDDVIQSKYSRCIVDFTKSIDGYGSKAISISLKSDDDDFVSALASDISPQITLLSLAGMTPRVDREDVENLLKKCLSSYSLPLHSSQVEGVVHFINSQMQKEFKFEIGDSEISKIRSFVRENSVSLSETQKSDLADKILATPYGVSMTISQKPLAKNLIVGLLGKMHPQDLIRPQIQGLGGTGTATHGLTGTGAGGHYVNSPMASIAMILQRGGGTTDPIKKQETLIALTALTQADLHPSLQDSQAQIINATLQEIAFPETIAQHNRPTCTATTAQIALAIQDPVKYIKIMTDLVSPNGECNSSLVQPITIHDSHGEIPIFLQRLEGTEVPDNSGRSVSSRIMQSALMSFAKFSEMDGAMYNNSEGGATDRSSRLSNTQLTNLMEHLFEPQKNIEFKNQYPEKTQFINDIKQSLAAGIPVSLGVNYLDENLKNTGGHRVLVTAIEGNNLYFMNPTGQLQFAPLNEFANCLENALIPKTIPSSGTAVNCLSKLSEHSKALINYQPLDSSKYNLQAKKASIAAEMDQHSKHSPTVVAKYIADLKPPLQAEIFSKMQPDTQKTILQKLDVPKQVSLYLSLDKAIQSAMIHHLDPAAKDIVERL